MPIFKYRGLRSEGKETSGTIEADSLRDATLRIKNLGLYPRSIELHGDKRKTSLFRKKDRNQLSTLTRQLSVLLRSGVPLAEALNALSEESKGYWWRVLVDIKDRVVSGTSLSRSLDLLEGGIFPEFYINMVSAGEESGTLDTVLEELADFLESQNTTRDKIRTATIYPLFMAGVGILVLTFLFMFVVPKIVRIFDNTQAALPFVTILLIKISNLFINYWWLMFGAALGLAAAGKAAARKHRKLLDKALFGIFSSLYLARFSRNLGVLLKGGIPMLRALELAGRTGGNLYLEGIVRDATISVTEGSSLAASLSGLPPVLLQLIATGERSGSLPDVLRQAAASYEAEFSRKVRNAIALLEPAIILLMSIVVGFIVFAVLLPMFQLNQLVQ
jgi:general secretion pathway protein F